MSAAIRDNDARQGEAGVLSAEQIVNLQDRETRAGHQAAEASKVKLVPILNPKPEPDSDWLELVGRQHRANFELWHIEDEARAPGATDAELAAVKRRVDQTNQRRNDLVEGLDRALLAWLEPQGLPQPDAALNSESPGLMIDRLSILALKIYHSRKEAERADAPEGHAARNLARLAILEEQRADLAACLDALWRETLAGKRRFKLYRQLKMYNDPSLNPAIYSTATQAK
jgi:hypothetical protein